MKNKNDRNMFQSKLFFDLFGIPSIVIAVLSLLLLIPDKTDTDPLTFLDIVIFDSTIIFIWFLISTTIIIIINKIKNKDRKWKKSTRVITKEKTSTVLDENKETEKIGDKGVNQTKDYSRIKVFMIILFIITLASLWIGVILAYSINQLRPNHTSNFNSEMWVFWCLLPIPLLSIILGIKYRKKGLKCTKNIVGGIIISLLLVMYGSFSLSTTLSKDYTDIYEYKDILGLNIPKEATSYNISKYVGVIDEDKYNYETMTVTYTYEENSKIISDLNSNPNWILSKQYDKNMKEFLPPKFKKDKYVYYSIYNETTKEYNVLPSTNGKYKIITMFYHTNYGMLEIKTYEIDYHL